jgi:hypothetical protein
MSGPVVSEMDNAHGIGLYLDPNTGQVYVAEGLGLALGAAGWIVAVVLGLVTAWLVLP